MLAAWDYVDALNKEKQPIARAFMEVVETYEGLLTVKMSYGVPFFHYKKRLMYLNGAGQGVKIGFCDGMRLTDNFGGLMKENRKIVAVVNLSDLGLNVDQIKDLIHQAIALQDDKQ